MLDINIALDKDLREIEILAIEDACTELKQIFPERKIMNYGFCWGNGNYGSTRWYINHADINRRGQLVADSLIELLKKEPWQVYHPHIDVLVVSEDLTAMTEDGGYVNFCFGATKNRFTVLSVARFRKLLNVQARYLSIKRLFEHELGHILGMASNPDRSHVTFNLGYHCTNHGCTMRQGTTIEEWANLAIESYSNNMIYCPECIKDASRSVI